MSDPTVIQLTPLESALLQNAILSEECVKFKAKQAIEMAAVARMKMFETLAAEHGFDVKATFTFDEKTGTLTPVEGIA